MVKKRQKKIKKSQENARWAKVIGGIGIALIIMFLLFTKVSQEPPSKNGAVTKTEPRSNLFLGIYPVLDKPSTHQPGKVRITEFLSFYCGNCYRFNGYKKHLKEKYGERLEIELRPIYWGKQSVKPPKAYVIALRAGKGEEMKDAIFKARFVDGRDIGDVKVLEEIASGIGLSREDIAAIGSGAANNEVLENIRLAQEYGVEETPTLILDGNIKVTPHETGDDVAKMDENLDKIIGGILRQ